MTDQELDSTEIPNNIKIIFGVILLMILIGFGGLLIYEFLVHDDYWKGAGGIVLLTIAAIILFNPKNLEFPDIIKMIFRL